MAGAGRRGRRERTECEDGATALGEDTQGAVVDPGAGVLEGGSEETGTTGDQGALDAGMEGVYRVVRAVVTVRRHFGGVGIRFCTWEAVNWVVTAGGRWMWRSSTRRKLEALRLHLEAAGGSRPGAGQPEAGDWWASLPKPLTPALGLACPAVLSGGLACWATGVLGDGGPQSPAHMNMCCL